jgi:hypothetical protein
VRRARPEEGSQRTANLATIRPTGRTRDVSSSGNGGASCALAAAPRRA